ncbi:hypothetical protein J3R30DRAFT_3402762 [Lentinula aciculospora]|uniref:Uncharacterized protein n=1 Tax=Lentinula aciculospora TaxID=153920 RepID=A0A9W9AJP5_9AGAR|nr:hypothetical protein J3R30DRAFT_3402762 [Lentinula aciculospora]
MKFLPISLLCAIAHLCRTHAAYLAVHEQANLQEGFMMSSTLDERDSQYLCDVMIDKEAFQISVHSTSVTLLHSPDDWSTSPLDGRELSDEFMGFIKQHFRTNAGQSGAPMSTPDRSHLHPSAYPSFRVDSLSISCQQSVIPGSALRRRIGFMHVIDLLSIVGVGFLAAIASGVAALLRRQDCASSTVTDIPRSLQLNHLHERPATYGSGETEYVFDYIKSKLG